MSICLISNHSFWAQNILIMYFDKSYGLRHAKICVEMYRYQRSCPACHTSSRSWAKFRIQVPDFDFETPPFPPFPVNNLIIYRWTITIIVPKITPLVNTPLKLRVAGSIHWAIHYSAMSPDVNPQVWISIRAFWAWNSFHKGVHL